MKSNDVSCKMTTFEQQQAPACEWSPRGEQLLFPGVGPVVFCGGSQRVRPHPVSAISLLSPAGRGPFPGDSMLACLSVESPGLSLRSLWPEGIRVERRSGAAPTR